MKNKNNNIIIVEKKKIEPIIERKAEIKAVITEHKPLSLAGSIRRLLIGLQFDVKCIIAIF